MDFDIEVEIDGIRYAGNYSFDEYMIFVNFEGKQRSTQIDGAVRNIESLAKQMVCSLVKVNIN